MSFESLQHNIIELEKLSNNLNFINEVNNEPNNINIFLAMIVTMPYPAWIKTIDSVMIYTNPAYEKKFNITPQEYHGKTDIDIWGQKASHGKPADQYAIKLDKAIDYYDTFNGERLHFLKWPVHNTIGEVIAIAGILHEFQEV